MIAPVLYIGAALVGGAQNLYSNWGKVKGNWKIGLAYFVSGAVGGMVSVTNRIGGGALTAYANLGIDIVTGNIPGPNASLWETAKYIGGLGLDGLGAASAPDIIRLGGRGLAALGGEWVKTASWFGKTSATAIAGDALNLAAEGGPVITATLKGVGERATSGVAATLGKNFANHGVEFIDDGARMVEQPLRNVLPRNTRLEMFKNDLLEAPSTKNPKEVLTLINKTLDDIENLHSGLNDRMYGILDNKYVTYHADGAVTALTRGHRIEIQGNGDFSIFWRQIGSLFLKK